MKKRLLSILLVLGLIIGIMSGPAVARAAGNGNYGTFVDGDHVISDMIKKTGKKVHPRLIMTEDRFAELRSHIGDGSKTDALLKRLRSEADREAAEGLVAYSTSLLEKSKKIQRRVAALALCYNIFGDEKYAERAYKELENAASFSDWNPYHFLDTGEMCTAFAFGYDWLYNWMSDNQREVLRTAMIEKGLNQVMMDYEGKVKFSSYRGEQGDDGKRSYRWYDNDMGDNWKFVCIGGTNLAALAIGDESDAREIASQVLTYGYKKAYTSVRDGYKEIDGSYIEGLGYWDYATYYLGLISSSLVSTAGSDYGIADYVGLRKSVDFVRYMSSNSPKSFNFGDDRVERNTGWAVFLWLGDYYNSYEMVSLRLRNMEKDDFNYLDVLWIDESIENKVEEESPTDWGVVGASNASFRNTWDENGIVAALHTGVNDYTFHGHYDLGTFYVESNGARFFGDLGNEDYELKNREYSYRIKAEGHNTLVINPTSGIDQKDEIECVITSFRDGNEAYAVTDLTEAYTPSGASSVVRGLMMVKEKKCVIVQDEIALDEPGEIYWFAHTKGQISIAADGRSAIVTVDSNRLWVGLMSQDGTFTKMNAEPLPTSRYVPNSSDNSKYKKLAIHLTNTKDTSISVACIPLEEGETEPSWTPSVHSLSEWATVVMGEEEIPVTKYKVTVNSGTSDKSEAEEGETVKLTAATPAEGKEFDKWVVGSGNVTLSSDVSATTTFVMPAGDVEVTAQYKDVVIPVTNDDIINNSEDNQSQINDNNSDNKSDDDNTDDKSVSSNTDNKLVSSNPNNKSAEKNSDSKVANVDGDKKSVDKNSDSKVASSDSDNKSVDENSDSKSDNNNSDRKSDNNNSTDKSANSNSNNNNSNNGADNNQSEKYSSEWVDGKWYNLDESQTYMPTGCWKYNSIGWWYEDSSGWYPINQWQKIDGKWYYFSSSGYMDYSEYRDGCWLEADGSWNEDYYGGCWNRNSLGWWYSDSSGWHPVSQWIWIDGVNYYFNSSGYMQ
ncbi:MAG: heparinase II/III family protein [Eubacterium sp.]|nr:heparinase II/III family protein [Eubacterium sp.]